jgi:hypothetical protein
VIAERNQYPFTFVRLQRHFTSHEHRDADKVFNVLDDALQSDFCDGAVTQQPARTSVVPKPGEDTPFAAKEVRLMAITLRGVR